MSAPASLTASQGGRLRIADVRTYATSFLVPPDAGVTLGIGRAVKRDARFEFTRLIEDRAISILQPDLSKTGGITEAFRITSSVISS